LTSIFRARAADLERNKERKEQVNDSDKGEWSIGPELVDEQPRNPRVKQQGNVGSEHLESEQDAPSRLIDTFGKNGVDKVALENGEHDDQDTDGVGEYAVRLFDEVKEDHAAGSHEESPGHQFDGGTVVDVPAEDRQHDRGDDHRDDHHVEVNVFALLVLAQPRKRLNPQN